MAEEKESFVFYKSFFEALKDLKEKDRLKVYDAICELALNGNEQKLIGLPKTIFTLIKPQILANTKRYENGKKGGRPKKETSGFKKETSGFKKEKTKGLEENKTDGFQNEETKTKPNENVNENDNVNVNVNDLYLTLFNKYKKQIEEQPKRAIQIISQMKKTRDYELLTIEEQDKLFYDLMNPKKESE